ncbi:Protein of unknown function [Pyronema omphalodes CBS 100304]|uniref:Uncharacterized protein n=1 Tax=Pyronema omphalodes (strain CBS 100304) TaxID=1076935 RepID=U4LTY2_PYROM|nr:Protein of unknown function [Pyronema omphalodes CBS 100304]
MRLHTEAGIEASGPCVGRNGGAIHHLGLGAVCGGCAGHLFLQDLQFRNLRNGIDIHVPNNTPQLEQLLSRPYSRSELCIKPHSDRKNFKASPYAPSAITPSMDHRKLIQPWNISELDRD